MKRIILSALLVVFCHLVIFQAAFSQANANNKNKNRTPEQKADAHLKKMTQDLSLTSEQVPKVKAIVLDKIQKMDALKTKYANTTDKKAMHQEMKKIRDQKDTELKAVLTPEQYTKHVQMREEEKKKRMQNKENDNSDGDDDGK
jgi:periplasmic protein CpxP/Spy